MKKLDKVLLALFAATAPSVIILLIWNFFGFSKQVFGSHLLYSIIGWTLLVWIVLAFIICLRMLIVKDFREAILAKITDTEEHDEREALIFGRAAKFSYLSTLSLAFFLLFLSVLNVKIVKHHTSPFGNDKTGYVQVGINFDVLDYPSKTTNPLKQIRQNLLAQEAKIYFEFSGIPLSKSFLLLVLIAWQIGSYQFLVRKDLSS